MAMGQIVSIDVGRLYRIICRGRVMSVLIGSPDALCLMPLLGDRAFASSPSMEQETAVDV